ncbi:MAG: S8 family serine peptidase [Acidimicrobiia bacterium]|nr:S8 family serine peptidase [Acidimicrobiia bacterium]
MNEARSVKWEGTRRWYLAVLLVVAMIAALVTPMPSSADDSPLLQVIVEKTSGADGSVEQLVEMLGGTVLTDLPIINGFSAQLPAASVSSLRTNRSVSNVTLNDSIQLTNAGWGDASSLGAYNPNTFDGSMYRVAESIIKATDYWNTGYTGAGIDIALIDSGVVPVEGLLQPGKVVNGPDLSFESQADNLRYLDTFGHGTHMAGIIAGRDTGAAITKSNTSSFLGVAPGSRIVSLKVADAHGATDVSQILAAIDWVVQHRTDNGMNIRVLNLSFGTDSTQSYTLDPIAFAVEQAWNAGIVVVVASGNDGNSARLRNPAADPFVIAVGSSESAKSRAALSSVMDFSNCGTQQRHVDLVVPGQSIVSLRSPGSTADTDFPKARVGSRLFLGSGTSQSAAIVSGMAALILDERPGATPDQVKALLMGSTLNLKKASSLCQGAGVPTLDKVLGKSNPIAVQSFQPSTGTGSLESARGSSRIYDQGAPLVGEQDIFGMPWDGQTWAQASAAGFSWSGGSWNGSQWTGLSWSGLSWSGLSWSGLSWSGLSWSGLSWSSRLWSDATWSGLSWSGLSWSGLSWSGLSWSGNVWHGVSWDSARPGFL